jgi:uncharacterized protein
MNIPLVDTNFIVRFKVKDNPEQAERARQLFEKVKENKVRLIVPEVVIAEVIFVLRSPRLYNLDRQSVADYLLDFIKLKGLVIPQKAIIKRALELYTSRSVDFVDAFLAAHMLLGKSTEVLAFDKDIAKLGAVSKEP